MRRHLQNALRQGIVQPAVVATLHGSLARLTRSDRPVSLEVLCNWAGEEGWNDEQIWVLRGIALAAANATPDLGELTSTTAAEGSLVVSLTRGETRLAYQALSLTLLGPYAVLESEYHTHTGFRTDHAETLLNALRRALYAATPPAAGRSQP